MSIEEIFLKAVDKKSPSEREAFLAEACGTDCELRAKVKSLLQAHGEMGSFLDQAVFTDQPTQDQTAVGPTEATVIGPYKLLQKIGEGGFGMVFMADQMKPVRRRVALKIIKPGMDSKEVAVRFEAERQALALMDHPNIAKVLDAGTTDVGHPYFVMELVKGVSITEYCDSNHLSTGERLRLFMPVCRAVQHAHQKGVIHRDLKPSNVMVTLHDGQPVPKVIDFGVSKAINQQLTEKTMFTRYGQVIGTPQYMSPEQAEMSGLDVDTRSDIYSLGVLLYELLTGRPPFDGEQLRQAGFDEMRRLIREQEPVKPSKRLRTLDQNTASAVATHRASKPEALSKSLQGELDWIVMRALEKDRNRRYETANNLADDVQRHLNHEPVLASPPSVTYALRKNFRRYRVVWLTTATVFLSLTAGLVAALAAFQHSYRSAQAATRARLVAEHQGALARQEAARANLIMQTLLDLLSRAGKNPSTGREYTVQEAFVDLADTETKQPARGVSSERDQLSVLGIHTNSVGQQNVTPDAAAGLHFAIGRAYYRAGRYELAGRHLERALEFCPPSTVSTGSLTVGSNSPGLLTMIGNCCFLKGDLTAAQRHLTKACEVFDPQSTVLSIDEIPHFVLALTLRRKGELAGAAEYKKKALELGVHSFGSNPQTWAGLVDQLFKRKQWDLAEDACLTAIELTSDNNRVPNQIGFVFRSLGRQAQADEFFQRNLRVDLDNNKHIEAAWDWVRRARVHCDVQDYRGAEQLLREALSDPQRTQKLNPFTLWGVRWEMATVLQRLGRLEEARVECAAIAEQLTKSRAANETIWDTPNDLGILLECELVSDANAQCDDLLRRLDELWRACDRSFERSMFARGYGMTHEKAGSVSEAVKWLENAAVRRQFYNETNHCDWVESHLLELYVQRNNLSRAHAFFTELLAARESELCPRHPALAFTRVLLARTLILQNKELDKATQLLRGAKDVLEANELTPAEPKQEILDLLADLQETKPSARVVP